MTAGLFRLRPVLDTLVQARQLTDGADWDEITAWCGGELRQEAAADGGGEYTAMIVVPDGPRIGSLPARFAFEDDWVVKRLAGFVVMDAGQFADMYEPAGNGREPAVSARGDNPGHHQVPPDAQAVSVAPGRVRMTVTDPGAGITRRQR